MIPAAFDYARPASVDEAVALLARHGADAKILAGGHSLLPAMKLRLAQPKVLIDLGRVQGLRTIDQREGGVVIGAMATHDEVAKSPLLQSECPLLSETARHIGDAQVRNRGTIGGSLVHADPAADWPAAILALDAELVLAGPRGRRTVPAQKFFVDLLQSAAGPDEILCEIRVPAGLTAAAYVKTEQKASGFALCGVAAIVERQGVRVAVTGVSTTPYRAAAVERALQGQTLTDERIAEASRHAATGASLLSDIHGSAEYRAHLAEVNTRRALGKARALAA
jgi:carbon-monoxide dehydrogenase medium subunit